ncbi:MAG TPA: hypothetical protein VJV21_02455 [Pyrinomonadaceae bacterium]|nr:hypothetical protein [Pyrinomonadaceae bacterium]
MTITPTVSTSSITRGVARIPRVVDHAPMVITRLSGWINVGENKAAAPAWIIPTRSLARR